MNPVTCRMRVEISVPEPGEYALVIGIKDKDKGNKGGTTPVVKYLVTTDKSVGEFPPRFLNFISLFLMK